jgi:hypothetical protein
MIIERAIEVNGALEPENLHLELKFGSHCDGESFFFFESDEERITFYENLNKI